MADKYILYGRAGRAIHHIAVLRQKRAIVLASHIFPQSALGGNDLASRRERARAASADVDGEHAVGIGCAGALRWGLLGDRRLFLIEADAASAGDSLERRTRRADPDVRAATYLRKQ